MALLIGLGVLISMLIQHFIVWQIFRPGFMVLLKIATINLLFLIFVCTYFGDSWTVTIDSVGIYVFLVMAYLHWYVGVDRSVSIRVLNELMQSRDGLTMQELLARYPQKSMFEHRIELMIKSGWLKRQGQKVAINPKFYWFASWTLRLRRAYNLKVSG